MDLNSYVVSRSGVRNDKLILSEFIRSSFTFSIGIIGILARQTAKNMQHHGYSTEKLNQFWADSEAFILMAAVVYIIATIFKIGINLQEENELTV